MRSITAVASGTSQADSFTMARVTANRFLTRWFSSWASSISLVRPNRACWSHPAFIFEKQEANRSLQSSSNNREQNDAYVVRRQGKPASAAPGRDRFQNGHWRHFPKLLNISNNPEGTPLVVDAACPVHYRPSPDSATVALRRRFLF